MKNATVIMLVVCLAMTAPTFGSTDYSGLTTINAASGTAFVTDARIAPTSGSSGTIDIVSGGIFNTDGETRFGEDGIAATVNVQVGGILNMDSEALWNEGEVAVQKNRLNVFGTAYVQQLKMYGLANDDIATVGNGTDAATLTIREGLLGKDGDASITINAGSTMIITGDAGVPAWDDFYKIDANNGPTDSYIDLVGGTLKVADHGDASFFDHRIKGNGVLDAWVMTAGTGDDAGFDVYTAAPGGPDGDDIPEPATMALLGLAVAGLGGYVKRRRKLS